MNSNKFSNITDSDLQAALKDWYYTNNGPLSQQGSNCSWVSGITNAIEVVDGNKFREFLLREKVNYRQNDNSFQLYSGNLRRWPSSSEDDLLFKGNMTEQFDDEDGSRDPLSFWRTVSKYMVPNTFFRVIELGHVGFGPFVFERETSYFALAIAVTAEGEVTVQDFEDYFFYPYQNQP